MNPEPLLRRSLLAALLAAGVMTAVAADKAKAPDKDDEDDEKAYKDGKWEVLFDGKDTSKWRGFKAEKFPEKGWVVESGTLRHEAGKGGGDLVSKESYGDFELRFDWKVAPGANSGVMYRVTEDHAASYETGPEYQVLDDAKHGDGKNPKTSSAALYALIACNAEKALRPVGEWNKARIVVKGGRVEHWLNKKKVVEYAWGGPETKALIAASKFKDMPGFAKNGSGHIVLQDHGDDVWFRKIKIRRY
jgi:hypothetical protein